MDSLAKIIGIILLIAIGLGIPLLATAERTDDVSKLAVQTATSEFGMEIENTGEITLDAYEKYQQTIYATGNSFDIDITVRQLDENPGVKVTQAEMTKIGENVYWSKYTKQVMEDLNTNGRIKLKQGDRVVITAKNSNDTIAELLRDGFYKITGNESAQIVGKYNGIIAVNGSN